MVVKTNFYIITGIFVDYWDSENWLRSLEINLCLLSKNYFSSWSCILGSFKIKMANWEGSQLNQLNGTAQLDWRSKRPSILYELDNQICTSLNLPIHQVKRLITNIWDWAKFHYKKCIIFNFLTRLDYKWFKQFISVLQNFFLFVESLISVSDAFLVPYPGFWSQFSVNSNFLSHL